jgi:hypothetical protein
MLVRFSNADGCSTCTQTIDFNKLRAIWLSRNSLKSIGEENRDDNYFVSLSFDGGDTYLAKENMTLLEATSYRNTLEGYWGSYNIINSTSICEA